jgi:CzcA family heavy metal efflux pump
MMRWIVGSSLKFRRFVIAAAAAVMIMGIAQLEHTPADILPEFSPPTVEIQTEALGLSAPEVEQLVTAPLEQQFLNGVPWLEVIRSESVPGLSSIVLVFEPGTDILDARQMVAERLTQAHILPNVSRPPQMLQPLSSTSRVMMVQLSSDTVSPIDLSVLARWVIAPRILGVDGVANVAIWGQRERQLQVLVDPDRLRAHGVVLNQIISTTGNALEVSPLTFLEASTPGTGGWIDTANQRLHIFHEQAISTPEELAQVTLEDRQGDAVFRDGEPLVLGDVTDVVEGHQPLIGDAICRGEDCLLLVIEKFPEANTPQVTEGVDDALDAMSPGLPGVEIDTSIYRPAKFLEASFANLGQALLIGGMLLIGVLLVFRGWRAAVISSVAIALSLVVAGLVLRLGEVTVNTMILAGLVLALIVLIDDAVVDVDNISRRLREHSAEGNGGPRWWSVVLGTLETRSAILFASLITVAALLPFFFLDGEGGAFLPPLLIAYLIAIAASMVVALVVTPSLAAVLLAGGSRHARESAVARRAHRGYERVSSGLIERPALALGGFVLVVLAGVIAVPFLDTSLGPSFDERDVLVHMEAPQGTSLPRMTEITSRAVEDLGSVNGVRSVGAHIGRAVMSDQTVNVNQGDLWVEIDSSADYDDTLAAIQSLVDGYPDVSSEVRTYSEERVTEVLARPSDEIVVRLYGEDHEELRETAERLRTVVSGVGGVVDVRVDLPAEEPALEVRVDLDRARAFGIAPGQVRREAATLLSGITVGNLFEEQKVFDVVVWGTPDIRRAEGDVRELLIDTPDGGHVRLGDVADVTMASTPAVIRHEATSTYLDVVANVEGRDIGAVAADVERRMREMEFPFEHHANLLGGFEDQQAARTRFLAVAAAALTGVFLLLQAAFASWRLATLVMVTLPMALAGGVLATAISGGTVSLGAAAGLVAVFGVAVRHAVLLVRRYQSLERHGGQAFGAHLVSRGTRDRLVPILMTTLGGVLLLLPIVLSGAAVGLEIMRPMAIVLLGGLIASAALSVVVLPALYLRFGFVSARDAVDEDLFVVTPEPSAGQPVEVGG